jgi:ELWxxDGT repeat protein
LPYTLFAADNGTGNIELWGTDGETGRTLLIKEIKAGSSGSFPTNYAPSLSAGMSFAVMGNFAYFAADDGVHGNELWRSDGTTAGTTEVSDVPGITPGQGSPDIINGLSPQNIVVANGLLFFIGYDPNNPSTGYGVYKTNGVSAPTLVSHPPYAIAGMASNGSRVYWTYDDGNNTTTMTSDGTTTRPSAARRALQRR